MVALWFVLFSFLAFWFSRPLPTYKAASFCSTRPCSFLGCFAPCLFPEAPSSFRCCRLGYLSTFSPAIKGVWCVCKAWRNPNTEQCSLALIPTDVLYRSSPLSLSFSFLPSFFHFLFAFFPFPYLFSSPMRVALQQSDAGDGSEQYSQDAAAGQEEPAKQEAAPRAGPPPPPQTASAGGPPPPPPGAASSATKAPATKPAPRSNVPQTPLPVQVRAGGVRKTRRTSKAQCGNE